MSNSTRRFVRLVAASASHFRLTETQAHYSRLEWAKWAPVTARICDDSPHWDLKSGYRVINGGAHHYNLVML